MSSKMKKEAPFRLVKREVKSIPQMVLYYFIAVVAALLIGVALLSFLKVDALKFYKDMITIGTIDNLFAYKNVENLFKIFIPLLFTSLALSLSFKMRFWNVGGEGQFIIGALVSCFIAITCKGLPTALLLLLMIVAGGLAAGLYGMLTAVLKVKFSTNETLMTLMMNYIAMYILYYFAETKNSWNLFLDKGSDRPRFVTIPQKAFMPSIKIGDFSLNISILFVLLFFVVCYFYLKKSKQGYEISVVGDSINTARYAGMKVGKIIIRTVFISAFFIGVAGACHVSTSHTLSASITNNVGWNGVIVAWLSKLNPVGILFTSFLISILQYGCSVAGSGFDSVDVNFANLLQGIILFSILVADFMLKFKITRNKATKEEVES